MGIMTPSELLEVFSNLFASYVAFVYLVRVSRLISLLFFIVDSLVSSDMDPRGKLTSLQKNVEAQAVEKLKGKSAAPLTET